MRSLAEDLKNRRQIKERLSIERMKEQYHHAMDAPTPLQIRQAARAGKGYSPPDTMHRRKSTVPN